jgi:hypothetical protein
MMAANIVIGINNKGVGGRLAEVVSSGPTILVRLAKSCSLVVISCPQNDGFIKPNTNVRTSEEIAQIRNIAMVIPIFLIVIPLILKKSLNMIFCLVSLE